MTENTEPAGQEPDTVKTFIEAVKAESNDMAVVRDLAKMTLVNEKRNNLADQLVQLFNKINQTKSELNRFRPDVKMFNGDGTVQSESWTKEKLDEKKKVEEKLIKMEKASAAAMNGNFDKVKDCLKQS